MQFLENLTFLGKITYNCGSTLITERHVVGEMLIFTILHHVSGNSCPLCCGRAYPSNNTARGGLLALWNLLVPYLIPPPQEHVLYNDTDGANPEEYKVVKITPHQNYSTR